MVRFLDGPAASVQPLRRAPNWMRVVIAVDGKVDGLDQIDDEPRPTEQIHVYELVERRGPVYVCIRGAGAAGGGEYVQASYRHLPNVDGESVRDTLAWRQWCADRAGVPLQVVLDQLKAEQSRV